MLQVKINIADYQNIISSLQFFDGKNKNIPRNSSSYYSEIEDKYYPDSGNKTKIRNGRAL